MTIKEFKRILGRDRAAIALCAVAEERAKIAGRAWDETHREREHAWNELTTKQQRAIIKADFKGPA